jgi:hypothetical protein
MVKNCNTKNIKCEGGTYMLKKLAKRKMLRRKYKHYAAALAGAAIMAGTTLHGIPFARAAAADKPSTSPSAATEQTTLINKNTKKPLVETDTTVTDPSATPDQDDNSDNNTVATPDQHDKNKDDRHNDREQRDKRDQRHDRYDQERYKHERWADREQAFDQRMAWYNDSLNKIQLYNDNANPVDIVMTAADGLGFDVNNDTFSLMSQSGSQSIVRVVHNGNNYDITVDHLSNGSWLVSLVNQIP